MSVQQVLGLSVSRVGCQRWLALALVLVPMLCGPVFADEPTDPTKIIFINNPNNLEDASLPTPLAGAKPIPLPRLARSRRDRKLTLRNEQSRALSIPPVNLIGNSVLQQPAGQVNVAPLTTEPFQTLGKLFVYDGREWHWCSAEFVGALDVILTAGHCAFDAKGSGKFFNDAVFDAGYEDNHPRSLHGWQCVAVYSGWAAEDYRYDFAFIKLRSAGTAALGLQSNSGRPSMTAVGYASNYYSGEDAVYVSGILGPGDEPQPGDLHMAGNSLSRGSSGGAWIDNSYAESLNSFRLPGDWKGMYGPVFDDLTVALFDFARKGCSGPVADLRSR